MSKFYFEIAIFKYAVFFQIYWSLIYNFLVKILD